MWQNKLVIYSNDFDSCLFIYFKQKTDEDLESSPLRRNFGI